MTRWTRTAGRAALLVLAAALVGGCPGSNEGLRTRSARVDYVLGSATINGEPAVAGETIPAVFTVITEADSSVGIIFDEKNILHIDAATEAYIDLAADVRGVELRRGTLASALRKLSQVTKAEPERFRVKTPSAVAGVRGTVFFVKVEDASASYVCTCNGSTSLRDSRGQNTHDVEAAHHKAWRFTLQEEGVAASEAPMLYHTDQMMELGAQRIGETIDWSRVGP